MAVGRELSSSLHSFCQDRELRPEEIEGEMWGCVPWAGSLLGQGCCSGVGSHPYPFLLVPILVPILPPILFDPCLSTCSPQFPHLSTCSPHFPSLFLSFYLFILVPIAALVSLSPHPGLYLTTHSPSFQSQSPSLQHIPFSPHLTTHSPRSASQSLSQHLFHWVPIPVPIVPFILLGPCLDTHSP